MFKIDPQLPHIRRLPRCPNCRELKDQGLILCWPCNHLQKQHNDGGYSKRLADKLNMIEAQLAEATS